MVGLQRVFIHIVHMGTFRDFVFFYILWGVIIGKSESLSNGGLTKDFHPHGVWNYITWFLYFVFFYIAKPDQIIHFLKKLAFISWKSWPIQKAGRTFLHCPAFWIAQLFQEMNNLIWIRYIVCIVTTEENESRQNDGFTKSFHPHHTCDYVTWLLDSVFFFIFYTLW